MLVSRTSDFGANNESGETEPERTKSCVFVHKSVISRFSCKVILNQKQIN